MTTKQLRQGPGVLRSAPFRCNLQLCRHFGIGSNPCDEHDSFACATFLSFHVCELCGVLQVHVGKAHFGTGGQPTSLLLHYTKSRPLQHPSIHSTLDQAMEGAWWPLLSSDPPSCLLYTSDAADE